MLLAPPPVQHWQHSHTACTPGQTVALCIMIKALWHPMHMPVHTPSIYNCLPPAGRIRALTTHKDALPRLQQTRSAHTGGCVSCLAC